jgi:hypothetical protein
MALAAGMNGSIARQRPVIQPARRWEGHDQRAQARLIVPASVSCSHVAPSSLQRAAGSASRPAPASGWPSSIADLLILDDLSYVRRDQAETSVLFGRSPGTIGARASPSRNTPFSQWGEVFVTRRGMMARWIDSCILDVLE